jgi:TM2 domain-containing membrane protein YozV
LECFALELRSQDTTRKSINPRAALIRSAIIPGWGQIYVHKPIKAVVYVSLEAYHLYQMLEYQAIYQHIEDAKAAVGRETWINLSESQKKDSVYAITNYKLEINTWRPREKRNKYAWWSLGFYLVCMLDAYVDAHLYYFPDENVELSVALKPAGLELNLLFNFRR